MTAYYESSYTTHENISDIVNLYRFSTFYEIIYCRSGYMEISTQKLNITANEHSCVIIPPYLLFKIKSDNFKGYTFSFNTSYLKAKFSKRISTELAYPFERNVYHCILSKKEIEYIERMQDERFADYSFFDLARLLTHFKNTDSACINDTYVESEIERISEYIYNNISKPLHIDDISGVFSTTPLHVNRLFKRNLSVTPAAYISEIRFINAVRLLSEGTFSLDEICRRCGYLSRTHFQNVFKARTGITPKKFEISDNIEITHYFNSNIN